MKDSAGIVTPRALSCEASARIRWHLNRLEKARSANERLLRLRLIEAAAHDAWELEVWKMDSFNAVHADPALSAAHGEPTV